MKRRASPLLHRLEALHQGQAVMSVVPLAELRAGLEMQTANRAHDEHVLSLLIRGIPVLSFDKPPPDHFSPVRFATSTALEAADAVRAGTVGR